MVKKIKPLLFILLLFLLIYTRLINLDWGLPYPMHPDERNMAHALSQLNCSEFQIFNLKQLKSCFNPEFFAYGQFPLYLGFFLLKIYYFLIGNLKNIFFTDAVIILRAISGLASVINAVVLLFIFRLLIQTKSSKNKKINIFDFKLLLAFLIIIFSPFFIQFSHFGTTESLLMLFYSIIVYLSILLIKNKKVEIKQIIYLGFFSGLAISTKTTGIFFISVPIVCLFLKIGNNKHYFKHILYILFFLAITAFSMIIFSPHNIISQSDFLSSMRYESDVAFGRYVAFYTRQFKYSIPTIFQLRYIFPYALGLPLYISSLLGFLFLTWKKKEINLLRFAFLVYFIPQSFLFAKWIRFITPIFPIALLFSILFFLKLFSKAHTFKNSFFKKYFIYILFFPLYISLLIPGIAYLSIYTNTDIRFKASKWIYENIPDNSYILSETANVVDLPIIDKKDKDMKVKYRNYTYISFNFYDLDNNALLQKQLKKHIENADYIFIPSRRVFANNTCINEKGENTEFLGYFNDRCNNLKEEYPEINKYYKDLFSGNLGFKKIAEFSSYPKFSLFGHTLITLPDEDAEETWTVFDHPVFRIYMRKGLKD